MPNEIADALKSLEKTAEALEIQTIEIDLLLEALFRRYGYDFRNYSRHSIERRLAQYLTENNYRSYLELAAALIRNRIDFLNFLPYFSISVTALFRDPFFYAALRDKVLPILKTWPHFKIWHAGCATGEEPYSMAILLDEHQILERATLYATDISSPALETARLGIYSLETMKQGSANYMDYKGIASLSDYYHVKYGAAKISSRIKKNIAFSRHSLVDDKSFGEMQLIICRNVLIYFNEQLKNQVLELFFESLEFGGYLCLGDKESLMFSSVEHCFSVIDDKARIYKKITYKLKITSY